MTKFACVTLDMEPDYGDPDEHIRLLENPEFLERYVSIINKHNAKVTMFTVTSLFEKFGGDLKVLAARIPLEYAVHSHSHDPYNACSMDEVNASVKAFKDFTGKMPLGYRAPIGRIDKDGLSHLLDHGFAYDASVYTSIRPGRLGYSNLHMPNVPFKIMRGETSLVEFPFTSLATIRIVFALSYAKLLGWGLYSTLLKVFGLPNPTLLLSHPHDFYFRQISDTTTHGLEKLALSCNSTRAFDYFEKMIIALKSRGHQFIFMSELYQKVKDTDLQKFAWDEWK
jgi:peptidoglycan/xylan/chitin deacetylase (PgdA/CDA1 family)